MKTLLALVLLAGGLFAQVDPCANSNNPIQVNVPVTTNTATTLVTGVTGQVIHVCFVAFATGTSTNVTFQGSDGTVLWGPLQGVLTVAMNLGGNLSTARAAKGSGLQILFGTAPASAVGVLVTYYLANN
jgi:hypothetical protein